MIRADAEKDPPPYRGAGITVDVSEEAASGSKEATTLDYVSASTHDIPPAVSVKNDSRHKENFINYFDSFAKSLTIESAVSSLLYVGRATSLTMKALAGASFVGAVTNFAVTQVMEYYEFGAYVVTSAAFAASALVPAVLFTDADSKFALLSFCIAQVIIGAIRGLSVEYVYQTQDVAESKKTQGEFLGQTSYIGLVS